MSVRCEICGKEFKTTQGRRGHMTFVHQLTSPRSPPAQLATEQELSNPEDRMSRLEGIIGIRELSQLEKLLGSTEKPLNEQVSELSEQLCKSIEQLKSEYVSRETMEAIAAELTGKFESLQQKVANTYKALAITVQKNSESCENSLLKIKGQFGDTANKLYELSKTVEHIQESAQANHDAIYQLNTKLVALEHKSTELNNKVDGVKNLSRRVPTGKIVGVQLKDKREHHFREYKSSEALARPYRHSRDLILGDRWIDLAEPED